jgi:hypothetical protein
VLPSSAGAKPQVIATTEKFLRMLEKHTGKKYKLEVKSVDSIGEEDVVALPFSASGPVHVSALTKAIKDSKLKGKCSF